MYVAGPSRPEPTSSKELLLTFMVGLVGLGTFALAGMFFNNALVAVLVTLVVMVGLGVAALKGGLLD